MQSRLIKTKIEVQFAHKFWLEVASNSIALWFYLSVKPLSAKPQGTLTTEKKGFCPFQQVDFKVPKIECFDAEEIPYTDCVDAEKIQMTTSMVCKVTVYHSYSD